jgi:hypothetical protein
MEELTHPGDGDDGGIMAARSGEQGRELPTWRAEEEKAKPPATPDISERQVKVKM